MRPAKLWALGWEVPVIVMIITGVALLLRIVDLTSIPTGLHGDEAIVGMEAQRVLRDIVIPPYSWSALGQPAGPFYLAALTVWLWGDTVLAVRMSAVIFGTLAIPALFIVVRRSLGLPVSLLSATLLAVMGWHIHYSRIAFPLPAWPLWVIVTAGVLTHAAQTRSPGWWAAAGAMSGAGIYVYNAHPLTLAILAAFAFSWIALEWKRYRSTVIPNASAFAGALLASLLPMLWFVLNNTERYVNSLGRHSVRDTDAWQQLDGLFAQLSFLYSEYLRFWWRLSFSPRLDSVDATGITEVVTPIMLALALSGMILGLMRYRSNPLIWLGAVIVLLMPVATVVTVQGEMRRTFVIAPFIAMFSAVAIVEAIRFARTHWRPVAAWGVVGLFAVVLTVGTTIDLRNYFTVHGESPVQHWVFAEDFYEASIYMQSLDDDAYVYFMSERWSIDYEPRRFLAPDVRGEDRSDEFGDFGLEIDPDSGRPVFVLVGNYLSVLEELQAAYPDGKAIAVSGSQSGETAFIAYELPE